MLSKAEKEKLYEDHKGIIYYLANRLRYLDSDYEELVGWASLGFVVAMNRYAEYLRKIKEGDLVCSEDEEPLTFSQIAFPAIRIEIYNAYRKKPRNGYVGSLNAMIGDDGSELGDYIATDQSVSYSEREILCLLKKALVDIPKSERQIIIEHFTEDSTADEIGKKHKVSKQYIARTIRRGQATIKKYLVDNDIVDQNDVDICNQGTSEFVPHEARPVRTKDYGKIKYIRKAYPYLSDADIAYLLGISTHLLMDFLGYPPVAYRSTGIDDSIKEDVLEYAKDRYPGHIPGEVRVFEAKELATV